MATKTANKILVIDDDSEILDFLIELLQDEISVSFASEGPKALDLVAQHKPDLILLDVVMPGMDGFEVCKLLKENPDTQHIPVVFITGKADPKDMAKGLKLGAVDYMIKPFDPEIVAAKIQNILKQITATRAATKSVEKESFVQNGASDRRAGGAENRSSDRRAAGASRPDRYNSTMTDNGPVIERRAQGPAREDRFPKSTNKPSGGMTIRNALLIALVLAVAAGGGYAWYSNENPLEPDTSANTEAGQSSQNLNLSESDMQSVIAEPHQTTSNISDTQTNTDSADTSLLTSLSADEKTPLTMTCDAIPKVPWWGNASHSSIIAYVNDKNSGNWEAYTDKWIKQLLKLQKVQAKGGTVIAPKIGTRLTGPVLAEYITQVEKRVDVTRCIARIVTSQ